MADSDILCCCGGILGCRVLPARLCTARRHISQFTRSRPTDGSSSKTFTRFQLRYLLYCTSGFKIAPLFVFLLRNQYGRSPRALSWPTRPAVDPFYTDHWRQRNLQAPPGQEALVHVVYIHACWTPHMHVIIHIEYGLRAHTVL